jgi:hypothetical protein
MSDPNTCLSYQTYKMLVTILSSRHKDVHRARRMRRMRWDPDAEYNDLNNANNDCSSPL